MKFTKLMSAGVISAMMLMASNAMAASITYTGMQTIDGASVDYSFTTDGTIGAINNVNLLDFRFDVAKSGVTTSISASSAEVSFYADGLFSATPTTLNLNISNPFTSFVALTNAASISISAFAGGNFTVSAINVGGSVSDFGSAPIATADAVSAVPEPATWAMMIGGFGGIGGVLRQRRRAKVKVSFA